MREYAVAKGSNVRLVPLTYDMRGADAHMFFTGGGGGGGGGKRCSTNGGGEGGDGGDVIGSDQQHDSSNGTSGGTTAETQAQTQTQNGHTHYPHQNLKKTITTRLANLTLYNLTHLHHHQHSNHTTSHSPHHPVSKHAHNLFAFPAQSNFSGVRHPLTWVRDATQHGWHVLLDATSYASHTALDLSAVQPDFVTVSFYKLFGFPTGVAALIVRRSVLKSVLRRPWVCGRTGGRGCDGMFMSLAVSAPSPGIGMGMGLMRQGDYEEGDDDGKDLVSMFEDGGLNYACIPAVLLGLDFLNKISMSRLHHHVSHLTRLLLSLLSSIHWSSDSTNINSSSSLSSSLSSSSSRAIRIYGPEHVGMRGGIISFDVVRAGVRFDARRIYDAAVSERITLGVGSFDNPGALEYALDVDSKSIVTAMGKVRRGRHRCSRQNMSRVMGRGYLGCVRVSVGVANSERDVRIFGIFIEKFVRKWEKTQQQEAVVGGGFGKDNRTAGDVGMNGNGTRSGSRHGSGKLNGIVGLGIGRRVTGRGVRPASASLLDIPFTSTPTATTTTTTTATTDRVVGTAVAAVGIGQTHNQNVQNTTTTGNLARASMGSIDALRKALNADTDGASDESGDDEIDIDIDNYEESDDPVITPATMAGGGVGRMFDRERHYQHYNSEVGSNSLSSAMLSSMRAGRTGTRFRDGSLSMSLSGFSLDREGAKAQSVDESILYGDRRRRPSGGRWSAGGSGRRRRGGEGIRGEGMSESVGLEDRDKWGNNGRVGTGRSMDGEGGGRVGGGRGGRFRVGNLRLMTAGRNRAVDSASVS